NTTLANTTGVTVGAGGILSGTGTIGTGPGFAPLTVNGTVSPGVPSLIVYNPNSAQVVANNIVTNNIGTMTMGALTFNDGSFYKADMQGDTAGNYDQLIAKGIVTLNGTVNLVTGKNSTPPGESRMGTSTPGNVVTLIQNDSASPITGAFNNLPVTGTGL